VLEIFLYGGISPWETFYTVEQYGRPDDPTFPKQQIHTFLDDGPSSIKKALDSCGASAVSPLGAPFATDALGVQVNLGPFAHVFSQRPDIADRTRLLVQQHRLEPHEAAVPQALTGRPVGQPSAAGLGSHIQRYFREKEAQSGRSAPYSYLFATGGITSDNVDAAVSTGAHPGDARPLKITITNAAGFTRLLARGQVSSAGDPALYDELMQVYVDQYRQRLRFPGRDGTVRSRRFNELALAVDTVGRVATIREVLPDTLFTVRPGESCGRVNPMNVPGMSLNAARHLLMHPTESARYVCVSDIGLFQASGGGGYDTHTDNSHDTAQNLLNVLNDLFSIIKKPGEVDATKLDLNDTLIVLNTEFGRTPTAQDGGSGRNHWPYGYVTAMIGGPITSAERGIFGSIGPDGRAGLSVTPAQNRIGALLALGIWPFSPESFAVADSPGAGNELGAALDVTARVLGIQL
jgi:hypothetical protein